MDIEQARFNMIEQQIRPWDVLDTNVLDVIQNIPRENFVSEQHRDLAFTDIEIPIGHDQVMMSPKVEARMLQALNIRPTDKVLEIGTGSGYMTACLAKMAEHVTTCEYFEDLASLAIDRLHNLDISNTHFIHGDVFEQTGSLRSYDVIAITGSLPENADGFFQHLSIQGRMFCILGEKPAMSATLVTRAAEDAFRSESLFETVIPPLLSTTSEQVFTF